MVMTSMAFKCLKGMTYMNESNEPNNVTQIELMLPYEINRIFSRSFLFSKVTYNIRPWICGSYSQEKKLFVVSMKNCLQVASTNNH